LRDAGTLRLMGDLVQLPQGTLDWALFRRFRYLLGNEKAAMEAFRHLQGQGPVSKNTWEALYKTATAIAGRSMTDYQYRKDGFREELLIERDEFSHEPPSEKMAWMRFILGDTPPRMQRLAIFRFVDGMSTHEISTLESISKEELGTLLSQFAMRATEIIRERISREGISLKEASAFRMDCSISGKQEGCPSEIRLDAAIGNHELLDSHLKQCSDCRRRMRFRVEPPTEFRVTRQPTKSKTLAWVGAVALFLAGVACGYLW